MVDRNCPLGQGVGEDGPANGQRTARHDDARHPDFPASEPRRIQRYHHGLVCSQQCQSLVDQRWADDGLVKGRPTPPAPHSPQARPAGARVLGRQGPGQRRRSRALCDEETQHRPDDRHDDGGMRPAEYGLDPAIDRLVSYLGGRHDCSLLQSGGVVIGTVYDDRTPMSSG